jgi:hypothetical protein
MIDIIYLGSDIDRKNLSRYLKNPGETRLAWSHPTNPQTANEKVHINNLYT